MRRALVILALLAGCNNFDFGHYPQDTTPPQPATCDSYGDAQSCAAAGCDALACDGCDGTAFVGCYEHNAAPDCEPVQCGGGTAIITCSAQEEGSCVTTAGCSGVYDEGGAYLYCTDAGGSCVVDPVDAGCGDGFPACADGYAYLLDDNGCPAGCVDASLCSAQD